MSSRRECDLETGPEPQHRALRAGRRRSAPLRDAFNARARLEPPGRPGAGKAQRPGHLAYIEASKLRAGLEHEADPRTLIRDYLVQRVEHGAVKGRADVVSALEDVGLEVPRQGKDYITARDPDTGKRWRLKGELYERDFEPERLDLPAAEPAGGRPEADRGDRRARARAALERA